MFGIGRWLKKTAIGKRVKAAQVQLEELAADAGFQAEFATVKHALEKLMDELQTKVVNGVLLTGAQKWAAASLWLRTDYPNFAPYIAQAHKWATAWVNLKKAAGLYASND